MAVVGVGEMEDGGGMGVGWNGGRVEWGIGVRWHDGGGWN